MTQQTEFIDAAATTRVARTIGLAGLVGTVLLMASLAVASPGEPQVEASIADAARYVTGLDRGWVAPAEAVSDIAMMILLWFLVGLPLLLRRFEGEVPVRSTIAALSGVLVAGFVVLDASQAAAAHRYADLDNGQLAYAYDVTSIGFSNVWLPMGSFAFACGWIIVATKAMPRWLGWWGVCAGIALGLAQFVWQTEWAWAIPYAAFWLWLLTTCVLLVRRPGSMGVVSS